MSSPVRIHAASPAAATTDAPASGSVTKIGDWVETPTAIRVLDALTFAHTLSDVVVVYGAQGVGKSETALHYARQSNADRRDANVMLIPAHPAVSGVVPFLEEVCDQIGMERENGAAALHRKIVGYLKYERGLLLIVDEAQHLTPATLEQLRSIHDATGLGLAFMGSRDLYARLTSGKAASDLESLRARVSCWLHLTTSSEEDAAAFAIANGIKSSAAHKLLAEASAAGGLRRADKVLRLATLRAKAAGRARCDADLRAAWREFGGGA